MLAALEERAGAQTDQDNSQRWPVIIFWSVVAFVAAIWIAKPPRTTLGILTTTVWSHGGGGGGGFGGGGGRSGGGGARGGW